MGLLVVERRPSSFRRAALAAFVVAFVCGPASAATDVRTEPGGTRFMHIDGNEIRLEPGGTRLLYIDENTIRTAPGAPHVLYVDGDNLRPEPGGVRVAFFDGNTLRRSPGGPVLLVVDGKDIRKEAGGQRLLYLDGDPLSRQQLAAALYQWNPGLFKLSAAELAKIQEEMKAAADASSAAELNKFLGKFTILNSNIKFLSQGTTEIARQGDYYSITMDFGNGQKWIGIGVPRKVFQKDEIWVALGPTESINLGIYDNKADTIESVWIPYAALKSGAGSHGGEKLTGQPVFNGKYSIDEGKHMLGRGTYSGQLNIGIFPVPNDDQFKPRFLEYTFGNAKVNCIGAIIPYALERQSLIVASSTEKVFAVGRISEDTTSGVHLDFSTNTKVTGFVLLDK